MIRAGLIFASISGAIAVSLGAFGAHALKDHLLGLETLAVFQTAVSYQFYHTFLLFIISYLLYKTSSKYFHYASLATMIGILLFSGSLYILSISGQNFWGIITPAGGLLFILGWGLTALGIVVNPKSLFNNPGQ